MHLKASNFEFGNGVGSISAVTVTVTVHHHWLDCVATYNPVKGHKHD